MEPIIRALLAKFIGPKADAIPIISNGVEISPDGSWRIVFRDESRTPPPSLCSAATLAQCVLHFCHLCQKLTTDFGHDKSRAIKPYAALPADHRPIMVYCGDGVSDISAARETDLLFAKKGRDLVTHCLQENVPFYPFDVPPESSNPLLPSTVLFYYRSVLLSPLHLFYFGFVVWG